MDKFDATQLDLFAQNSSALARRHPGTSFLLRFRLYERAILLAIGFIIIAVVAFALGVEQGRRLASASAPLGFDAASKQPQPESKAPVPSFRQVAPVVPKAVPFAPKKEQPVVLAKGLSPRQGYTIQIASFKSRDFAQQEASALRRLGFNPTVLASGSYVVLCVGNFSDKESAKSVLADLSKKYQGCFLRRI
jgi:cell division septation protein DedD